MITKDYMKSVLSGAKGFLKMKDVKFCNPPAYDEIGVKALYDKVVSQPTVKKYFPDKFPKGKTCDRSYMYNVWNTVCPDDVEKVLRHANDVRYSLKSDKVKENTIIVTDEWQQELASMPFTSKQKGRMSALLKQKSKVGAIMKNRISYDAFDFKPEKRMRDSLVNQEEVKHSITMASGEKKKIVPKVVSKDVKMRDKSQDN